MSQLILDALKATVKALDEENHINEVNEAKIGKLERKKVEIRAEMFEETRVKRAYKKDLFEAYKDIERLKENIALKEHFFVVLEKRSKEAGLDNIDTLCHEEMVAGLVKMIAKLKEEKERRSKFILEIGKLCIDTGLVTHNVDHLGKVKMIIGQLKEREAEANSYRDLYNEFRAAVLAGLNLGDKAVEAHPYKEVLRELECIKNERDIFDEHLKDKYEDWDEYRLKYDRLIALLKREANKGVANAAEILQDHRYNEKKLKAKAVK
jgi:hypothetical protein